MKALFSITAALTALLGLSWLFATTQMLGLWGVQGDAVAVYMARRYAGLFFGYSVLMWLSRNAPSSEARSAILAGGAVVTAVMAAVSLLGVLTGTVGPAAWSAVAIEVALAMAFSYFYATAR